MVYDNAFFEISVILMIATLLGFIGRKLKQPLLIMFLVTGILAGPSVFGIIESYEKIELLANMGIALLLFIVGLKLDLKLIRSTGPVALATGIGQIFFTSVIGFFISLALGMSPISSAYVSVALTFSSTIIIVKLLSDKKEIDSLHGQIAIGFLIVQDIAAILALVGLTTFGTVVAEGGGFQISSLLVFAKGLLLLVFVGILMQKVIPYVVSHLANSLELLTLFAIAWAVFLGAGSEMLGFTKEVGAFLAGVSLASTDYRDSIGARLASLRDFLLLFFFIDLGARLNWADIGGQLGSSFLLSIFVLIGNPLIVLCIMGAMGYKRRTSFLAGLTVAQISEFSLIVAALGLSLGHINSETMGLITLVGVITISVSSYMIIYSANIYNVLSDFLKIFERKNPHQESGICNSTRCVSADVVLVGLGNYGGSIAECLLRRGKGIVGVDFDPRALQRWSSEEMAVIYGDMSDIEIYEQLPLSRVRWVISTVKSLDMNLSMIQQLKHVGYNGNIALTADKDEDVQLYQKAGVPLVFRPFSDAAEQAVDALTHAMSLLPKDVSWPISFSEVRVPSGSPAVGKKIRDICLNKVGVSVLAIVRAGHVYYEPGADFHISTSDRILLMGDADALKVAEQSLSDYKRREIDNKGGFQISEVSLSMESKLAGKSLEDIHFRKKYKATVVGIKRGEKQIISINPKEMLLAGDKLVVIGVAEAIAKIKESEPL